MVVMVKMVKMVMRLVMMMAVMVERMVKMVVRMVMVVMVAVEQVEWRMEGPLEEVEFLALDDLPEQVSTSSSKESSATSSPGL